MILASILITDNENEEIVLPAKVVENIDSFKRVHPGLSHQLFTRASIRQFIKQHFDSEVLKSFEKLRPFAYQADLARHCIMYVNGGVYADLSIYFFGPWSPKYLMSLEHPHESIPSNVERLGLFRDFQSSSTWDTVVGIYSSPPRHRSLLLAIQMICENVKRGYYGMNSLCPTGPAVFGKAVASTCYPEDVIVGDSKWIAPRDKLNQLITENSHGFVFRNKVVAIRRKRGGGSLAEVGITGGNQYPEMWSLRKIYGV